MSTPVLLSRREDWTLFRNLGTLGQKAGVPIKLIPRLVIKELADNGLDAGSSCRFAELDQGGFFIEDDGPGIDGTDEEIAELFSIARPLTSSKLLRLPTRGALGNGLRVVAGAVLSSGGSLSVSTRGRSLQLVPQDDGTTRVERIGAFSRKGTRIELQFGSTLTGQDINPLKWCRLAQELAGRGKPYVGRSSPWWYDTDSFWELLQASGQTTVRDFVEGLEGCTGRKGAAVAQPYLERQAKLLTRSEAESLLGEARNQSRQVKGERLGFVGPLVNYTGYARLVGHFTVKAVRGKLHAEIPVVVEAWANVNSRPSATFCVNRTPVTAEVRVQRDANDKKDYAVFGCSLSHGFAVGRNRDFSFLVNVQCPYMPLTTDGKAPDFEPIADIVLEGMVKAARRARRGAPKGERGNTQKAFVFGKLPEAIEKVSGRGQYRYSLRQLFYQLRPALLEQFGEEPKYGTFADIITKYENAQGKDLPGIYRDARGTLYHPHTGEQILLGTRQVEKYQRPAWTFNKILYCEKEGFFPILLANRWPERHDCALLTSKGFASRAARDVLDLMGASAEELLFFCVHDADGPGTMIYQSLQQGTQARPSRKVKIVNLGLEPEEALQRGLQVERVERKNKKAVPVASYVSGKWKQWLQQNRVELNAMSTPAFLAWLDQRMAEFDNGKLVPPAPVLRANLEHETRDRVSDKIRERILRQQRFEEQAESEFQALLPVLQQSAVTLPEHVTQVLADQPQDSWRDPVRKLAADLAGGDPDGHL